MQKVFDVIVVGGGHSGIEAALIAAKRGVRVLCVTFQLDLIGHMACNPSVGGVAKGIVAREVDALGGMMGKVTDHTGIQFRMLNTSKGPAVWAPRAQVDRVAYSLEMQRVMQEQENLTLWQGEVASLLVENHRVQGIQLSDGQQFLARAVILTTGTFLRGKVFMGQYQDEAGRLGEKSSVLLGDALRSLGLEIGRMKTGTPVRIDSRSVDYTQVERQENQETVYPFSHWTQEELHSKVNCYITYTNPHVHEIIYDNLSLSPMYGSQKTIEGIGPRYCPSIEDKIIKFPQRERHQVFLEPETLFHHSMYVNGISTSLPAQVQEQFVRQIPGLQNCRILKMGYAVEYDFVNPIHLKPTLESKAMDGLFFAGQINGTTGYEEAAGQGILAGINAAQFVLEQEPCILHRENSYIGIMVDDLITKGVTEPYRLFSSSSEYRLSIRYDNADERLFPIAAKLGLIDAEFAEHTAKSIEKSKKFAKYLGYQYLGEKEIAQMPFLKENPKVKAGDSWYRVLVKGFTWEEIQHFPIWKDLTTVEKFRIYVQSKYDGYLKQQDFQIKHAKKLEDMEIPQDFSYSVVENLSLEAKEKLTLHKPFSIGQAKRISGVTSADIWNLVLYFKYTENQKQVS